MADTPDPNAAPASGFTLDLSTGKPGRPRAARKGPPPVVQKTINLSTKAAAPRPEPEAVHPKKAAPPKHERRRDDKRSGGPPRSSGTSLADLLDEATLARLRGEG